MWAGCVEAVTYIRPHVGVLPTLAALCLPHHTIPTLCVAAYVALHGLTWPYVALHGLTWPYLGLHVGLCRMFAG